MKHPETPKRDFSYEMHSETIHDPFQWLEDGDDYEVKEWIEAQNEFFQNNLEENANVDFWQQRIEKYYEVPQHGTPYYRRGHYRWGERLPGEQQGKLLLTKSLDEEPEVVIDPNEMDEDGLTSLNVSSFSPDYSYFVYGIIRGGEEIPTLYIRERETGKEKELFRNARGIGWLQDESGFYYSKFPEPGEVPEGEERLHMKLYFHEIGTGVEQDKLIFERSKNDIISFSVSRDDRYILASVFDSFNQNDLYLFDRENDHRKKVLAEDKENLFFGNIIDGHIYVKTDYQAPNNRIIMAPVDSIPESIDEWSELIPESDKLLKQFNFTKDKLLLSYDEDISDRVEIYDHKGNYQGDLPIPDNVEIGISASDEEAEFFFSVHQFTKPRTVYRYNPQSQEYEHYYTAEPETDSRKYTVKQEWYESKDGTQVPMFIVHKKELTLNGANPTILYGYGGYGLSQEPGFMGPWLEWMNSGGVYIIANIRGGGEFGEEWHKDGILENKQNTFDDFIAAAEYLQTENYTSSEKLAIMGGSNGGLTVGAAFTQRPDLFKAAVCSVPVLDMYRYHKFLIAGRWVHEWGDPDNPEHFEWLRQWSPYHNVDSGAEYPSVLFKTAENDTRVEPFHARKMTALLQSINDENSIFLRTEMDMGHGIGTPVNKQKRIFAETLGYLSWQLNVEL